MRWLTDGMETSLVILVVAGLALLAHRLAERPTDSAWRYAALMSGAAVLILFRIELAFISASRRSPSPWLT